jgi:hypothetical protein
VNVALRLWRLGRSYASRSIAGSGVVGLAVAGVIGLSISDSQQAVRITSPLGNQAIDLPIVAPIVSSDPTSVRLNSTQIALKEAKIAVSRSQAQLVQSQINLIEFQAKHNNAKILYRQGKVSRQQVDSSKSAHKLMQVLHSSASIGLQESIAQLIATKAKAEVVKL